MKTPAADCAGSVRAPHPTGARHSAPQVAEPIRLQASFKAEPGCRDALVVRRCDDRGKVAGLASRRLENYEALLRPLVRRGR